MFFADRLTLDAPRLTRDGYLVTRARAARTGFYSYDGAELDPDNAHGLRDAGMVNVLRDDATVFDAAAVRSFIGKPVTDDHPTAPVTAANWKDYARGIVMGAMRDGDYLAFDLMLTDADAIKKVQDGKRELSNGYSATLAFGDFKAPDGTPCVARQTALVGNHCAIVGLGRAGPECRIADSAVCESIPVVLEDSVEKATSFLKKAVALHEKHMNGTAPTTGATGEKSQMKMMEQMKAALAELEGKESGTKMADERTYSPPTNPHKTGSTNNGDGRMPHTLIIDGLQVTEVSDQAKAAIEKLQGQAAAAIQAKDAADTKVGELTAAVSTKDGEIAALTQKVKDAEISPAQLEKLVADRSALIAQAKAIDPNIVTDGKTEGEIRKAVVSTKLGDAAKDMNDGAIGGAFAVLAKDVKVDPIRNAMSGAAPTNIGDAKGDYQAARDLARKNLSDGWKQPAANAA
jgi:hypothetical protein